MGCSTEINNLPRIRGNLPTTQESVHSYDLGYQSLIREFDVAVNSRWASIFHPSLPVNRSRLPIKVVSTTTSLTL